MEAWLTMVMTSLHAYGTIYFSMLAVALLMPEEPALLACGLAVGAWQLHPLWALMAAVLGVLSADLGLYSLGRFGRRPLAQKLGLETWLPPERRLAIEQGFRNSGALWLIAARLLPIPGLRTGVFVSAGVLHYPWWRFVLCDAIFLAVVGGILVVGGYYCADMAGRWMQGFDTVRSWLYFLLMLIGGAALIWKANAWLGRKLFGRTWDTACRQVPEPTCESHTPHPSVEPTSAYERFPRPCEASGSLSRRLDPPDESADSQCKLKA